MTTVLDASVAVSIAVDDEMAAAARRAVAARRLVAPSIIDLEVASALARLERAKVIDSAEAASSLSRWLAMAVTRVELSGLVVAAFAKRFNVHIADGFYVALAESLGAPLITTDGRLARAPRLGVQVNLIERPPAQT
jgi:predicted nucleic acid-binding protein